MLPASRVLGTVLGPGRPSQNVPNESHTSGVFLLLLSFSAAPPDNLYGSRPRVELCLLSPTHRAAGSTAQREMPRHRQPTYILRPEADACASSSLLGPPPLTNGQPVRRLTTQICFFALWSERKQGVDLKDLGHLHGRRVRLLKLDLPFLSISFAPAGLAGGSELSESGAEDLPVRSR